MSVDRLDEKTDALLRTDERTGELVCRYWRIEVTHGPDEGLRLERQTGGVVVGSSDAVDLRLKDEAVSRRHLELRLLAQLSTHHLFGGSATAPEPDSTRV